MFQQIEMPVTIRHSHDLYMEQAVGVIIAILADLCDSHLHGDPDVFSILLGTVLPQERIVEIQGRLPADIKFRPSPYGHDQYLRALKLDWLFILDGRLCKSAKFLMRQIYARIYTVSPGIQDLLGRSVVQPDTGGNSDIVLIVQSIDSRGTMSASSK